MFCSSCMTIDTEIKEFRKKICNNGHIFCDSCDENNTGCMICKAKISKYFCVEINENIPRICYSVVPSIHKKSILDENKVDSYDSDSSFVEILNELNEYDKSCHNAECDKKRIIGCVQVIDHKLEDVSFSIALDGNDEREILKDSKIGFKTNDKNGNCRQSTQKNSELSKVKEQKTIKSSKLTGHRKINQHKVSRKSNNVDKSLNFGCNVDESINLDEEDEKEILRNFSTCSHVEKTQYPRPKLMKHMSYVDNFESIIVNKPSSQNVFSESAKSGLSFTTRSECCVDNSETLSSHSVYEFYKNDKLLNESHESKSMSLNNLYVDDSPPEGNEYLQKQSNACRAKFTPAYRCGYNFPAQMEGISYDEDEEHPFSEKESQEIIAISLPRTPIPCPCSYCDTITTPSDFFNHITIDHPFIEIIKVNPNEVINFKFCGSGNRNYVRCHQMFLLSGKVNGIGHGSIENCLPVLLLSCKFNLREIFNFSPLPDQNCNKSEDVLCVWLSSIFQYPVNYSLNVWKHEKDTIDRSFIKCISTNSSCLNIKETNLQVVTNNLILDTKEYENVKDDNNIIQCQIVFN